jgi:hypothetical protein
LILYLRGLTPKAPIRFPRALGSRRVRRVGACPRGAPGRWSGEPSENPLSSRKTRGAPRGCHFFYLRPAVVFPLGNSFRLAMHRAPLRFVATPPQPGPKIPDTAGARAHPKQLPDQPGNALHSPVPFRIPVVKRSTLEGPEQTAQRPGAQTAGAPGSTSARLAPGRLRFLSPAAHPAVGRADPFGDLLRTRSMAQQVLRTLTTACQLLGCAARSPVRNYRILSTSADSNF